MRCPFAVCLLSVWLSTTADAQDPTQVGNLDAEDLAVVGQRIAEWDDLRDNAFLFKQHVSKIYEAAQPLVGKPVRYPAIVTRVTHRQVFVKLPQAGFTRIVLRHATCPSYGNLGSLPYGGAPSARTPTYVLSKPIALRIGSEIDAELASQLRSDDRLEVRGEVEQIHLLLDRFQPRAIAEISNFQAAVTGDR